MTSAFPPNITQFPTILSVPHDFYFFDGNRMRNTMTEQTKSMQFLILILISSFATAFIGHNRNHGWVSNRDFQSPTSSWSMALGDFTVELTKPLGIILEEREAGEPGVQVESLVEGGTAAESGNVAPGDVLLEVDGQDVSTSDFELVSAPEQLRLTLGDGLGRMDIAKTLASRLSPEEAMLTDSVVRAAVRQIRKDGRLGDLLNVEIVIGAGVQEDGNRCLVRFFGIFSTDKGGTTYSCNVSATGVRQGDGIIDIVSLSCAKDEGLGQTIDLILERT